MKTELNMVDFKGNELVIREGKATEPFNPVPRIINGNIDSPLRWIEKNKGLIPLVSGCLLAQILVDKSAGNILLTINPKAQDYDLVKGILELHPDFLKFEINTGEQQTSHELAEKIKMWRSCFKDKDTAMKLVKDLRSFNAKINKELEAHKDDRANYSLKKSQIVESNLPESFILNVPIFKGEPKQSIEVEINIDADKLTCSLISPEANDYIAEFKEQIIDEQIRKIQELTPDLVIIEQ